MAVPRSPLRGMILDPSYDPTVGEGGGVFNVPELPAWSAAVRAMKAGQSAVTVLCLGDSTTQGTGANGGLNAHAGCKPLSYPSQLAAQLTAAGLPASSIGFMGFTSLAAASVASYDPTISFDDTSRWPSVNGSIGRNYLNPNAINSRWKHAVAEVVDSTDFWMINSSVATLPVYLDGGVSAVGTVAQTAGDIVTKTTISYSAGAHSVEWASSAGVTRVLGFHHYNSAQKQVRIHNAGWAGGRSTDLASSATAWATLPMIDLLQPHLTTILIGTNDMGINDEATYKAACQSLIDKARLYGDVILMTQPPRGDSTGTTYSAVFRQYVLDLQTTNSLQCLDVNARWGGTYNNARAGGYMQSADPIHPAGFGYQDVAAGLLGIMT